VTLHALDKRVQEVNPMAPLYTLLLCLPAALALIVCAGGLAALWSPTVRAIQHHTAGRQHSWRPHHETQRE
jgi:hypothetical protein